MAVVCIASDAILSARIRCRWPRCVCVRRKRSFVCTQKKGVERRLTGVRSCAKDERSFYFNWKATRESARQQRYIQLVVQLSRIIFLETLICILYFPCNTFRVFEAKMIYVVLSRTIPIFATAISRFSAMIIIVFSHHLGSTHTHSHSYCSYWWNTQDNMSIMLYVYSGGQYAYILRVISADTEPEVMLSGRTNMAYDIHEAHEYAARPHSFVYGNDMRRLDPPKLYPRQTTQCCAWFGIWNGRGCST